MGERGGRDSGPYVGRCRGGIASALGRGEDKATGWYRR